MREKKVVHNMTVRVADNAFDYASRSYRGKVFDLGAFCIPDGGAVLIEKPNESPLKLTLEYRSGSSVSVLDVIRRLCGSDGTVRPYDWEFIGTRQSYEFGKNRGFDIYANVLQDEAVSPFARGTKSENSIPMRSGSVFGRCDHGDKYLTFDDFCRYYRSAKVPSELFGSDRSNEDRHNYVVSQVFTPEILPQIMPEFPIERQTVPHVCVGVRDPKLPYIGDFPLDGQDRSDEFEM